MIFHFTQKNGVHTLGSHAFSVAATDSVPAESSSTLVVEQEVQESIRVRLSRVSPGNREIQCTMFSKCPVLADTFSICQRTTDLIVL